MDRGASADRDEHRARRCAKIVPKGGLMTTKADFTEQEWDAVLEGPPSAGMLVVTASRGGTFRETFAIGRACAEARKQHGASELLDEIVSRKLERAHRR